MKNVLLILVGLVATSAFGQSTNLTLIPEDTTIFQITLKPGNDLNGKEVVYGAILLGDQYIEAYPENDSDIPNFVNVHLDMPEVPGQHNENVRKDHIKLVEPESEARRLTRYQNGGFVVVEGDGDREMLVSETNLSRMERLEALEQARDQAQEELVAELPEAVSESGAMENAPGFFELWGTHALIIAVALGVLFGLSRLCF